MLVSGGHLWSRNFPGKGFPVNCINARLSSLVLRAVDLRIMVIL